MILRVIALALATLAPAALAQTSTFELHINGKNVGKDTFTFTKTRQGWRLTSQYRYATVGNEGQFTGEYRYEESYTYVDGGIENTADNKHFAYSPNKARTELTVATTQAGSPMNDVLPIQPDFVLLPDFDAGAAQALLLHAVTHPTADNKYNVLIPSLSGPAGGGGRGGRGALAPDPTAPGDKDALPPGNHSYQAVWVKGRDVTGTLEDKPVTLHTYLFAFGASRWIYFADDKNDLMQLNVTRLHAAYIRAGFKLDPIKAPDAR